VRGALADMGKHALEVLLIWKQDRLKLIEMYLGHQILTLLNSLISKKLVVVALVVFLKELVEE